MKKTVTLSLMAALLCLQCPQTIMAKETINIGVFLPMTGNASEYGLLEWDGIRVAHQMMARVLSREIRLFWEDTKSDRSEAAKAVERLIQEHKVVGIIGGTTSANALAGGAIAEKHAVPMISPSATNPLVTRDKKYVFRVCFDDSFQGRVAARQAAIAMNAGSAAMVVDIAQEDYSVALANLFLEAFSEMGGKVVVTTYIQTGDQDFKNQLSEILAANPDIIYSPNAYSENALLAKQARDLGIKVPILMADGAQVSEFIKIGGKAVEEVYLTSHFNSEAVTSELGRDFADSFEKKYNKGTNAFGALGADAYFILIDAIERAESTEGPKVRTALANTDNFPGITGAIKIEEDGSTVKSLVVNKVKNGKFTHVTTVKP